MESVYIWSSNYWANLSSRYTQFQDNSIDDVIVPVCFLVMDSYEPMPRIRTRSNKNVRTAGHVNMSTCQVDTFARLHTSCWHRRFVFLHLYHNSFFGKPGTDEPIPVPESKWVSAKPFSRSKIAPTKEMCASFQPCRAFRVTLVRRANFWIFG